MKVGLFILLAAMLIAIVSPVQADTAAYPTRPAEPAGRALPDVTSPQGLSNALQWLVLVTVLSLVPAVIVMVTSFTRIVVVLGLLRQALATPQLPPNQILFALAMFVTLVVMAPIYTKVHSEAIKPYLDGQVSAKQALNAGEVHVREFMIRQMEAGQNEKDVYLFVDDKLSAGGELTWSQVPTLSLIPAFVLSELKIAFTMGFRIFLPFVIIDMLVSSVLISMGMLMVPPVLISLPFKLLLFVLADGWHLVVGTLVRSFG